MRTVLAQGFRSVAAEAVLDLNGDGVLNQTDLALMEEIVQDVPPAQVFTRNGRDINPVCLEALGNPVLGSNWRVRVTAAGVGSAVILVGYDQPIAGTLTPRGELLVRTVHAGGTKLFNARASSNGTYAQFTLPLPLDASLYGRELYFQALIVDGPDGNQFCNALDVVLSPFE